MSRRTAGYVIMLSLFLVITGCAVVKERIADYNACVNDVSCKAQMDSAYITTSAIVDKKAGLLGKIAGSLASLLTGLIAGRKLRL